MLVIEGSKPDVQHCEEFTKQLPCESIFAICIEVPTCHSHRLEKAVRQLQAFIPVRQAWYCAPNAPLSVLCWVGALAMQMLTIAPAVTGMWPR